MIFSIIIWLATGFNALHPFHVSVCDIEHDVETKTLQITHHIFLDDLEQTLRKKHNIKLDIVNPQSPEKRDEYIQDYVMEHFFVEVNGKLKSGNYLGHEIEQDAVYCYIEIDGVKKLKSIFVKNSLLTEVFDDQVNLVHIKVDEKIKSLKLDKKTDSGQITYSD